jgi:hypothetical protein
MRDHNHQPWQDAVQVSAEGRSLAEMMPSKAVFVPEARASGPS